MWKDCSRFHLFFADSKQGDVLTMPTKLDAFLKTIDPKQILDPLRVRADNGLNTFRYKQASIQDFREFTMLLGNFFGHMESKMIRFNSPRPSDVGYDYGRCYHLLKGQFGEHVHKMVFNRARTGVDGGLYGVLKLVADLMIQDYAGNEIRARVGSFYGSLSTKEQMEIPKEYVKKYGHLLPSDITEGNAVWVVANFPRVLEEHPYTVAGIRRLGR
jgi:hypothetical protein